MPVKPVSERQQQNDYEPQQAIDGHENRSDGWGDDQTCNGRKLKTKLRNHLNNGLPHGLIHDDITRPKVGEKGLEPMTSRM